MPKALTTRGRKRELKRKIGETLVRFAKVNEELRETSQNPEEQSVAEKKKIEYALKMMAQINLMNHELNTL